MKLNLNQSKNIVTICVPCRDTVHSMFTYSLTQLVQWSNHTKQLVNLLMETGSIIAQQRSRLADAAIANGSTHILWLDSDMSFPATTLETLLSHDLDIVACNYSKRSAPFTGTAYSKFGQWDSWLRYNDVNPRLQPVDGVGMGCMLVKTSVFQKIPRPCFNITWSEEFGGFFGEDFYFCGLAREAGYQVMIDTILSQNIKHIGSSSFGLSGCK